MYLSPVQQARLKRLGASEKAVSTHFATADERIHWFQQTEKTLLSAAKNSLHNYFTTAQQPDVCALQEKLCTALRNAGFAQVKTPVLMQKKHLIKMGVDETAQLHKQIFWLDAQTCLRPMLAPHLYSIMQDMERNRLLPVKFFEAGPCFRKDSRTAQHAQEFTMLNLVIFGLPLEEREKQLQETARVLMHTGNIEQYSIIEESSSVYEATFDIVTGRENMELASGACGPHTLDLAWKITQPWIGWGTGLERLCLLQKGYDHISAVAPGLHTINGIPLTL